MVAPFLFEVESGRAPPMGLLHCSLIRTDGYERLPKNLMHVSLQASGSFKLNAIKQMPTDMRIINNMISNFLSFAHG